MIFVNIYIMVVVLLVGCAIGWHNSEIDAAMVDYED